MTQLTLTGAGSSNGGGGFIPTDLSGLALWLRSDKGIVLNGSGVSSWTDQSPNAIVFSQATAFNQPVWGATSGKNSLPGLTFVGVHEMTGLGTVLSSLAAYTMFIVAKHTGDGVLINATGDAIGDQAYIGSRLARFGGGLGVGFGSFTQTINNYYLQRTVYDGSLTGNGNRLKSYENGVQKTLNFGPYNVSASLPAGVSNITIGRYEPNTAFDFYGILQDVIIYNRVLTALEITQVEASLVTRYGTF